MNSPSAVRGRKVRQRLTSAAVELIAERGWTAVSTRMLADRAGVTPSVVHYHFSSLQALLQEAALGAMNQAATGMEALLDGHPTDAVGAILAAGDGYTGTDPATLLFIETYLAGIRDPRFRDEIAALLSEITERFSERLAGWGVPHPHDTAAVLLAALDGLVLQRGLGIGPRTDAAADTLRRLVPETRGQEMTE